MLLFVRVVLSFALVGLLLWCFARAGAGRFGSMLRGNRVGAPDESLELLARRQISKNVGVVLVRSGTRHFLLGTGDTGLQVLAEGDDLIVEVPEPEPPTARRSALALLADDGREAAHEVDVPEQATRRSRAAAWTRQANPQGSNPARMNLFQAIREVTVRRS